MTAMAGPGIEVPAATPVERAYHERKHRVFQRMYDDQMTYRALMRGD